MILFIWNSQKGKFTDTKQTTGCQGLGLALNGLNGLNGQGVATMFATTWRGWLNNILNELGDTKVYALKWLIVCYVNFTSIARKSK